MHDPRARRAVAGPRLPRGWSAAGTLVLGGLALWAGLSLTGLLLTRTPVGGPVDAADGAVSRWVEPLRTPTGNAITHLWSSLADTTTAVAVTTVAAVALLAARLVREAITLIVATAGELFVFVLVTATVHRARPGIAHLDPAPPTSSFPSGHTGASVALYGCLSLILLAHATRATRPPLRTTPVGFGVETSTAAGAGNGAGTFWVRAVAVALWLVPPLVALARVYRGMHYPTDVVAGALGGGIWLWLTWTMLISRRTPHM